MAADISINLELVTQAFKAAMSEAKNHTDAFASKTKENFSSIGTSFGVMAGQLAANAIQNTFSAIISGLGNVINEAAGAEQSIANLNIALKSAGEYSKAGSQDLQDYAARLQDVTIYSDDAVMATEALLLSLTTLDKDGIKKATGAAADLAATLGISLETATQMIAKAVNGNSTAFKKLGIDIKSSDTEAGRLQNTLKALESQNGAAEKASLTFSGAMAKAKNQLGEVAEALGANVVKSDLFVSGLQLLSEGFKDIVSLLSGATENSKAFLTTVKIMTVGIAALTVAFNVEAIAAAAAWVATLGPIAAIIAGVTAVGAAVFAVVKYWDDITAAAYRAAASTIEYAAIAVGVFSADKAKAMNDQAAAWRNKADAIKLANTEAGRAAALAEKEKSDNKDDAKIAEDQAKIKALRKSEELKANAAHNKILATNQKNHDKTMANIAADAQLEIDDLKINQDTLLLEQRATWNSDELLTLQQHHLNILTEKQRHEKEALDLKLAADLAKNNAETDERTRREGRQVIEDKYQVDRLTLNAKQEIDIQKQRDADKVKLDQQALANQTSTLALFASLQNSNNKTMAAIGKAAALVQIAIATPVAVSQAFKFGTAAGGPILGAAFAGIASAAMAAQAAQVVGVKFAEGGIVSGSRTSGDRISAQLNSNEMVLTTQQQAKLFSMANNGGGSGRTEQLLSNLIDAVKNQATSVQIDGREIINVVRNGLSSGRSIA